MSLWPAPHWGPVYSAVHLSPPKQIDRGQDKQRERADKTWLMGAKGEGALTSPTLWVYLLSPNVYLSPPATPRPKPPKWLEI